jgi:hypothetical protein
MMSAMGRIYDTVDDELAAWLHAQPVFFVGTAPTGPGGHVNVSPKGYDTFRVLGPTTIAYLDLTGSGIETVAHLADNGRITLLFCAFSGPPKLVRLQGTGHAVVHGDERFDELASRFPPMEGARAVVVAELDRIATSCGYSVPFMELVDERPTLHEWTERRGPEGVLAYRAERNVTSIDGLPGLSGPVSPAEVADPAEVAGVAGVAEG